MSDSIVIQSLKEACETESGILTIIRIDNYEELSTVMDKSGTAVTSQLKEDFLRVIDGATKEDYIRACLGDDEFVIFFYDIKNKKDLAEIYFNTVKTLNETVSERVDDESSVYVEISMGAAMVPEQGDDYEELFSKADRALDYVSESGGHNIAFYDKDDKRNAAQIDTEAGGAMWLSEEDFHVVCNFMDKYVKTYKKPACEMNISFVPFKEDMDIDVYTEVLCRYIEAIRATLRESDAMTLIGNTVYMLLPDMSCQFVPSVISRITSSIEKVGFGNLMDITLSSTIIGPESGSAVSVYIAV